MDLPNIKIVVQWKATCNLCTLWQRFGRAACGQDEVGTAILLVEKKDTDEERLAKVERAAKRKKKGAAGTKRKAIGIGNCEKAKRPALVDRSLNRGLEEVLGDGDTSLDNTNVRAPELDGVDDPGRVAELAFKEECWAHYGKREKTGNSSRKGKSRADHEVGSPMDDFINTHACVNCRRIVPEVYFGNDQTRRDYHG
jgi:superfamily II DNA/RNA helicase